MSAMFRTMQAVRQLPPTLIKGIDRCIARLEYFNRKTGGKTDGSQAAELEARLLQRDLPEHIRASRRAIDKSKAKN